MSDTGRQIPDAHWGNADRPLTRDWPQYDDVDPDDEQLSETPPDVIAMLGFDPAKDVDVAK